MMVRAPRTADAARIAELLGELGYPTNGPEVARRLALMERDPSLTILVAEVNGEVAAVITAHVLNTIHASQPVAWITALVTDSRHRGMGLGSRLVAAVEDWARERRAVRLSVTAALHRTETHAFYERRGFARSGLRLTRYLTEATP